MLNPSLIHCPVPPTQGPFRTFAYDIGIASIGWAVLDSNNHVVACGVWKFPASESPKDRTPKSAERRTARGQRRILHRRVVRMRHVWSLFTGCGLVQPDQRAEITEIDPWALRGRWGLLDRLGSGVELARVLLHIARHRGFRSNSKKDQGIEAPDESKKMLVAMEGSKAVIARYRTVGEALADAPEFAAHKRNKSGDYSCSILRSDQEEEVRKILVAQRQFGSTLNLAALEAAFAPDGAVFTQRPLGSSEELVKICRFARRPAKCAAKASYAFEMFRFLDKVRNLRLSSKMPILTPDGIKEVLKYIDEEGHATITYKRLRTICGIPDEVRFIGVSADEETQDVTSKTGAAFTGSVTLRKAVGEEGWKRLMERPKDRDRIAEVISWNEDVDQIRANICNLLLHPDDEAGIMRGVLAGKFAKYKGAGGFSAQVCRELIPELLDGKDFTNACAALGYDHAASSVSLEDVRSAIAQHALLETCKLHEALVRRYGSPDRVHVELARELSKSASDRGEILKRNDSNANRKKKDEEKLKELTGVDPRPHQLLNYQRWKEQGCRCLLTGLPITIVDLVAGDNSVQEEHILPRSRFGDNSYMNTMVSRTGGNSNKLAQTPFEYFQAGGGAPGWGWNEFKAYVKGLKDMPNPKKAKLLLEDATAVEEDFRERNLNDTQTASKAFLGWVKQRHPGVKTQALKGPFIGALRKAVGLNGLKVGGDGKRLDDNQHHALDAILVGLANERLQADYTRELRRIETDATLRRHVFARDLLPADLRSEITAAVKNVFVAQPEIIRSRGEMHSSNPRRIGEFNGKTTVFAHKPVWKLKEVELKLLEAMPGDALRKRQLAEIRRYVEAGCPKDAPPLDTQGKVIRRVFVPTTDKVGIEIRGGAVDRGGIFRVDLYQPEAKGKSKLFAVPIYMHEAALPGGKLPCKSVVINKPESAWLSQKPGDFLFSLYRGSYVEAVYKTGEVFSGYFEAFSRLDTTVVLSGKKFSLGSVLEIRKYYITRLGEKHEIKREKLAWHGEVCT